METKYLKHTTKLIYKFATWLTFDDFDSPELPFFIPNAREELNSHWENLASIFMNKLPTISYTAWWVSKIRLAFGKLLASPGIV